MPASREVVFDSQNNRLVFLGSEADGQFWDGRWAEGAVRKKNAFVLMETRRYLRTPAKVVDAGCGLSNTVFGLHGAGYEAYGVDFAQDTIKRVKEEAPELDVRFGDVREMPFPDSFFDGYWSLGVIEHFFDGYDPIISEARRVLKPGGFLFLTVPAISPLRAMKIRLGAYQPFSTVETRPFYQFALQPSAVRERIESFGFTTIRSKGRGGYIGVKDEIPGVRGIMQPMYDSKNPVLINTRRVIDRVLSPLAFHTMYFVFRRH